MAAVGTPDPVAEIIRDYLECDDADLRAALRKSLRDAKLISGQALSPAGSTSA